MSFVNPTYLWALLGLLIPLAIHLWSKKEGKTIKIGSTKLLNDEDSKQSSSLSLNELLLLALRLLITALVVLIIAEPQFKRQTQNTALTYIVEPSLVNNENITFLLDSLKKEFPVLLLKEEFPKLEKLSPENTSFQKTPNYWQLAKAMETLKTDSIVVFTNALTKGLKGKRPTVNKSIDWIIFDTSQPEEHLFHAALKKDSVQLMSVLSKPKHLSFKKIIRSLNTSSIQLNKTKDSITLEKNGIPITHPLHQEQILNVLLYFEDNFTNEALYFESALNTISKYLNKNIEVYKSQDSTTIDTSKFNRIIWLSENAVIKSNRKTLAYQINDWSTSIITKGDTQNIAYITQPINPDNLLNKQFTEQLLNWLDLYPDLDQKSTLYDNTVVSKAELVPLYKNDSKKSKVYIETWSLTKWLCIVLAFLILFERVIAHLRKQ